jgi:hypothetical protein
MAKAKKMLNKRTNKSKGEIKADIAKNENEKMILKFKEMYKVFSDEATRETGMMLAANVSFDPARGLFPQLVLVKAVPEKNEA